MNNIKEIMELFKNNIRNIVGTIGADENIEFDVTIPKSPEFGDLTTNVALKLSSKLKKSPMELAQTIQNKLDTDKLGISRIEIKKPGFINLYLQDKWVLKIGEMVLNQGMDIIEKKDLGKLLLKYPRMNNTSLRLKGYVEVLKNILELKGYQVEISADDIHNLVKSNEDYQTIVIIPSNHKDMLPNNLPNEVIIVGDMTIFEGENNINSNIFDLIPPKHIGFWSATKRYDKEVEVNFKTAFIEDLTNPYFYVSYVERRTANILSILINEGYDPLEAYEATDFSIIREARQLIFKVLDIDSVIEEAIKYREPLKLFEYIYGLSAIFHEYNKKLLFRQMSPNDIVINMFTINVMNIIFSGLMGIFK